ncbi:S9 family peptidase [Methanoregula sp.]|uniref:S9 family peptidase n=1 Tax=Methanoregula sp. TaxID=2052170 RepID=UPI00237515DA|nr:S9 family peptidase [Methanoregula sp.]MDD1686043.1 S9 family peptidase [Methanoregula sp.]
MLFVLTGIPGVSAAETRNPADAQASWTIADTFSIAQIPSLDPSPDGKRIVYTVQKTTVNDTVSVSKSVIYEGNADGTGTRQLTNDTDSCSGPAWSPDGQMIAALCTEAGLPQIRVMNADGSGAFTLTTQETGVTQFSWAPDGNRLTYSAMLPLTDEQKRAAETEQDVIVSGPNTYRAGLYLVSDISPVQNRPTVRLLTPDTTSIVSWDWSPDGKSIATITAPNTDMLSSNTTLSHLDPATGTMKNLVPQPDTGSYFQAVFSPDGNTIAYSTIGPIPYQALSVIPAEGGNSRIIARDLDIPATLLLSYKLLWSGDGRYLYVPESNRTRVSVYAIAADGSGKIELFTCGSIGTLAENRWKSVLAYTAEDTDSASEIYITPSNTFSPDRVTRLNSDLPTEKFGKTETVRWTSYDGTEIEGLLTYPVNYTPGTAYPLIVAPHGGPSDNYVHSYTGTAAVLPVATFSSLGYAVLRPNIRGSTGYGPNFTWANYHDWGGGDYRDLMAGVDEMVARGIADPDRLGIIGHSYGGYMTAWTVTQTSRFKGAVAIAPITNTISHAGTRIGLDMTPLYFGNAYWNDWDYYSDRSPVRHIGNVSTPTLIITGKEDVQVPPGQGREFYAGLTKRGIPTQLITYPRAGHFPTEPKQVRDLWLREIAWMNQYVMGNT